MDLTQIQELCGRLKQEEFEQAQINSISRLVKVIDERLARNIEAGVVNYLLDEWEKRGVDADWEKKQFRKEYGIIMRRIIFNVSDNNNHLLREKLQNGSISVNTLPTMDSWQMFPEKWELYELNSTKRRQMNRDIDVDALEGIFECSKCKKNKTTYYQLQTRSADEPMTTFITCHICQKRWRC